MSHTAYLLFCVQLYKDLLHPSVDEEKRRCKLKRLVQSPNSYFMDVKCPGGFAATLALRLSFYSIHHSLTLFHVMFLFYLFFIHRVLILPIVSVTALLKDESVSRLYCKETVQNWEQVHWPEWYGRMVHCCKWTGFSL